jgi:hypothetical protein
MADDRVRSLRFDVAEGPRASRLIDGVLDGVLIVWVTVELLLKWRTHASQIVYLLVEIYTHSGH